MHKLQWKDMRHGDNSGIWNNFLLFARESIGSLSLLPDRDDDWNQSPLFYSDISKVVHVSKQH